MRLSELSASQYARLSQLLDESFELEPQQRATWLEEIGQREPQLGQLLRELLSAEAVSEASMLWSHDALLHEAAAALDSDQALVGKRFGVYRVLSLLGRGGMGSVWLAERVDGLFTRQVALKLVSSALAGKVMLERLAREREILGGLTHPHIARLLDAGFAEDGQPFLALEYVRGTPLTSYCDAHRLALAGRLELFRQVLSAVQYAHAHLVIHRDLKPSNILVSEDGQVHLLDFGIAKLLTEGQAMETQLTQLGGRALTPDYAAPEQIMGAPITTAADVYALGVMLYELLTGERPYRLKRDSRGALEEAILQADPQPPSQQPLSESAAQARGTTAKRLARQLRGDLDTIVLKALKKSPAERYATADAFGEDLGRHLHGEAVHAQRDSVAYRAAKFVRRHWVGICVAGALLLMLAAGLAATSYEARLAAQQRDAALQAQQRSLTQTAAARLKDGDVAGALAIILEVLPHRGAAHAATPEALSVFQEARAADAQLVEISGAADVWFVAFSPDGRRLATATDDKLAHIYDAASGRQLVLLQGHQGRVWSASFSADGTAVVTASADKTARIWDASSGRELQRLSGHEDAVEAARFSPDGRLIATGSADHTARLWEARSGRQLQVFAGHAGRVIAVAFSPDGRRLATASSDRTARVWDVASGQQLQQLPHSNQVTSVEFSPEGTRLVTGSDDRRAHVWDWGTAQQQVVLTGHTDAVVAALFFPDGQRAVTGSTDRTARIWDLASAQPLRILRGHRDRLESVALAPDGTRIATASDDTTTRVWDAAPGAALVLSGHTDRMTFAAFAADGRSVTTSSDDDTARIWDAVSGRELARFEPHSGHLFASALSPDGQLLVTAGADKTARIWQVASQRLLRTLAGHTDWITAASFSPDGRSILTASYDNTARLWDTASGALLREFRGHSDALWFAAFSPDGKRIVTASRDRTARIWETATARALLVLAGHADQVFCASFSADGRQVVTASDDKTARIWDAVSGRELRRLSGHEESVVSAVFSPDEREVLTASTDKTARIWDAKSGEQLRVLAGHTDHLGFAAYSPDGARVVTASDDATARLWDAEVVPLPAQLLWAQAAQFDPLPNTERYQLGLALDAGRRWPRERSRCDTAAAAPYDPQRQASGVMLEQLATDIALSACEQPASGDALAEPRRLYQRGRAYLARGDPAAARRDLETALAGGYRSARIELAMLLAQPGSAGGDLARAQQLYEDAWREGVTIAGFELGTLYERLAGAAAASGSADRAAARAADWYRRAAAAGQPHALARLGERAESEALLAASATRHNALLLEAFSDYAAAADAAHREDWPDEAWRAWRYRRASLAHLLERAGLTQQVAAAYQRVTGG